MRSLRVLWIIALVLFPAMTQSREAPSLQIAKWLQAPEGFDGKWSGLRGKVVVLQ